MKKNNCAEIGFYSSLASIGASYPVGAALISAGGTAPPLMVPGIVLAIAPAFLLPGVGLVLATGHDIERSKAPLQNSNQPLSLSERQAEKRKREKIDGAILYSKESKFSTNRNDKNDPTLSKISKNMS